MQALEQENKNKTEKRFPRYLSKWTSVLHDRFILTFGLLNKLKCHTHI